MPINSNWLTAWVKLNTKHGIHPTSPGVSKEVDRSKNDFSIASTAESSEGVALAKRSIGSKRNRHRGLQRTLSASDLIREAASSQQVINKSGAPSSKDGSSSVKPSRQSDAESDTLSTTRSSIDRQESPSRNAHKYLNESTCMQQYEQKQQRRQEDSTLQSDDSLHHDSIMTLLPILPARQFLYPPPPPPSQHALLKSGIAGFLPPPFFLSPRECQECLTLRSQVQALSEDVEYLRKVALQLELAEREYATHKPLSSRQRQSSLLSVPSLASKQLDDVTCRHRKQMEQFMKERSRWQQEMHFKLAKLANVCKELNDESSLRKLEANTLTQELRSVKMERDSVSEELFTLRAEMRLYEKHQQDLEAMKDKLTAQSAAVTARDATIADLTRKLERALTENELIKSQASQRRIIFPDSKR